MERRWQSTDGRNRCDEGRDKTEAVGLIKKTVVGRLPGRSVRQGGSTKGRKSTNITENPRDDGAKKKERKDASKGPARYTPTTTVIRDKINDGKINKE
jgi:hypothetical protein